MLRHVRRGLIFFILLVMPLPALLAGIVIADRAAQGLLLALDTILRLRLFPLCVNLLRLLGNLRLALRAVQHVLQTHRLLDCRHTVYRACHC